jgi:hypothetical protein
MLLVVNCQNGYLEKCQSSTLRNIVEAADLMDDVWMLTWRNPPTESFFKKVDLQQTKPDYEMALYPELALLPARRHSMASPTDYSKEMYSAFDQGKEVFIIGANTSNWLVDIALDLWSNYRIKPTFFHDAWFSVGPKGSHSDANLALTRRFGAGAIQGWESYKAPLVARRQASLAEKAAATATTTEAEPAEEAQPNTEQPHEG